MTVHFIGAGPGDPDLLTIKGRKLIERCPVCLYAGSLVPAAVVACAPPGAKVIDTATLHLDQIVAHMAEAHAAGQDVARVHSGDPSLYGAIAEQMRRLDDLGIPYKVVPGVSSFTAAAAALRLELTPAGANQTVILTRAAGRTGLPANEALAELARHRTGLVLFLSAAQVPEVVDALTPHYGPDAPVAVAYRVSWPDERMIRCTLATLAQEMKAAKITLTALIFVGPMLEPERAASSHLYDRSYTHRFRRGETEDGNVKQWPSSITVQLMSHSGAVPNVLLFASFQAKKNPYCVGPLVSNEQGQVVISRDALTTAIGESQKEFLMDYAGEIDDLTGDVEIRLDGPSECAERVQRLRTLNPERAKALADLISTVVNNRLRPAKIEFNVFTTRMPVSIMVMEAQKGEEP